MAAKPLIVLFGHHNDENGVLSQVAVERCDIAIGLFRQLENALILPTGAFGPKFNSADRPHASYLKEYLKHKGIPDHRILDGTDSSNTLEDCLCARKIAIDNGCTQISAVTSCYHMDRVKYLAKQIFIGLNVTFFIAPTPPDEMKREKRSERRSWKELKKEWVKPTLYDRYKDFPHSVYDAAANDQRHYDSISLATVTAMIVVSGYVIFFGPNAPERIVYFLTAYLSVVLFFIYEKTAQFSWIARQTMKCIEIGYGVRGFSANYRSVFPRWWQISVRNAVRLIGVPLILYLLLRGFA